MAETTSPNYPAALADSTSLLGDHSNQLSLTLGATCLIDADVITTTGAIAIGAKGVNAPGYCLIDSEIIHFTGVSGATLTGCTRTSAAGGGAAAQHESGATVYFIPTANWANQVKDEIIATQTELGINVAGQPDNLVTRLDRGMLEADNAATEALGGTKTLTDADFALQYLDPGGANRDVNLPAEAAANHAFVIVNTANADENLVVKSDAPATIVTVGQNQLGILFSDGTTWKGMVESPTEGGAVTTGIANTNTVVIDHASVADNDFAKFTSSGLEGRSYSETLSDLMVSCKGGDIASAGTTTIDTDGDYFDVTGTTTITGMTVAVNRHFFLQFDAALILTHHATDLDLPGEANITTAAGDVAEFFSHTADKVQCVNYTKADGTAVAASYTEGCRIYASGAQSIGDNTYTDLNFANLRYDTNSMTDQSGAPQNTKITFKTAGVYVVWGSCRWASDPTNQGLAIYTDAGGGTTIASVRNDATNQRFEIVTTVWKFLADEYVTLQAFQETGSSLNTYVGSSYAPEFAAQRIG